MNLKQNLTAFLASAKSANCRRLCIAYSGGIDSHVLLDQINQLNQGDGSVPLDAIYINHNLHNDSKKWGKHCSKICQSMDIPFQQIDVDARPVSGESPEEKARTVRYQALASELESDQWLLTAQHKEDQAETLLLQLLRGSGVYGLSAMPKKRSLGGGEHHRPLLKVTQQQIEQYAIEHQLQWIEDPGNQDQNVPRNYLRKTVIPALNNFWPETTVMLDRSADWIGEAADLLADIAKHDYSLCRGQYQSVNIIKLQELNYSRQKNLLRYWFHSTGLKRPGNEKLELIFNQIIHARDDANPQLDWQGISLRRYKEFLHMIPKWTEPDNDKQVEWDAESNLSFNEGILSVSELLGQGLSKSFLKQQLTLQLRQGGERCHPVGRGHSQSLKKLFQEYSVPPWLRKIWPLLYCNGEIIAVPGLFICKGFQTKSSEPGLVLSVDFNRV